MGHAQWTFISGAKESQGVAGQDSRALHQNQHTYSCKLYQRTSVLVIEVIFKPQNIAKVHIQESRRGKGGPWRHIHPKRFVTHEGEMIQKNKRYHCFQNSSISHRRTSQMIRRSPTAYEGGYTFYRKHCEMTSFQTRGLNSEHI